MELQFGKSSVSCLEQLVCGVQNQEQTQEIRVPEAMPDVGRVLAVWGQPILRGKEWRSNGMQVSGGVMAFVLYAPEDGSEPRKLDAWVPFQAKWEFPETDRDGTIRVCCRLRSMDARTLTARKLMLRVGIGLQGEAMAPKELHIYAPEEVPEDVQLLRRTYPMELPREAGEKAFLLDEDLTMPPSLPAMGKLIQFQVQPEVVDQKVMGSKAVFRGNARLHVFYQGEDGKLNTWDLEQPFSQYTELEGEYSPEAGISTVLEVTSLELEPGEGGAMRLKCGLLGQYVVSDRTTVELVEDAYSVRRPIELHVEPLSGPMYLDRRKETIHMEQTLPAESDRLLELTVFSEFPRQVPEGDGIRLEQAGGLQGIFYDKDGVLKASNARWEGSLSIQVAEDAAVCVWPQALGVPQTMGGSGGILAREDRQLELIVTGNQPIPMVTGLELGEEQEPDPARPSLVVRRVHDADSLWSLAKRCGSSVDAIQRANQLQGEPAEQQLLLIPVL